MASPIASPAQIKCKGVLFDMDGILVSSIGSVERSWSSWALMRGVDPELTCKIAHGQRAIDTLAQLRPDLTVLPGVLDLLAALPPRNGKRRWTVVTSATERLARARMAAGGVPAPDELVTAGFVTRGKPHPEPYLAGAALLGIHPSECVVFEDSASGAHAGRAAGCIVVATTFSHPAEQLDAAHFLVNDLVGIQVQLHPGDEGFTLGFTPIARQSE